MRARSNEKNTGIWFQKEIAMTCREYNRLKVACIEKVDPPVRVVGSRDKGTNRVIQLKNPFLDFTGSYRIDKDVIPIEIECKSTSIPILRFGKGGLTDSQIANVFNWCEAGHKVIVLWEFYRSVGIITGEFLSSHINEGNKKIEFDYPGVNKLSRGKGMVLWDFVRFLRQERLIKR